MMKIAVIIHGDQVRNVASVVISIVLPRVVTCG